MWFCIESVYIFVWTVCILYRIQRSQSGAMHFERVLGESEWEMESDRECDEECALALRFYVTISFMCQATRYDVDAGMHSTKKMNFKHVCGALHCVNSVADSNEHDLHFLTFKHVHSLLILCSFSCRTLQIAKKKKMPTKQHTHRAASYRITSPE